MARTKLEGASWSFHIHNGISILFSGTKNRRARLYNYETKSWNYIRPYQRWSGDNFYVTELETCNADEYVEFLNNPVKKWITTQQKLMNIHSKYNSSYSQSTVESDIKKKPVTTQLQKKNSSISDNNDKPDMKVERNSVTLTNNKIPHAASNSALESKSQLTTPAPSPTQNPTSDGAGDDDVDLENTHGDNANNLEATPPRPRGNRMEAMRLHRQKELQQQQQQNQQTQVSSQSLQQQLQQQPLTLLQQAPQPSEGTRRTRRQQQQFGGAEPPSATSTAAPNSSFNVNTSNLNTAPSSRTQRNPPRNQNSGAPKQETPFISSPLVSSQPEPPALPSFTGRVTRHQRLLMAQQQEMDDIAELCAVPEGNPDLRLDVAERFVSAATAAAIKDVGPVAAAQRGFLLPLANRYIPRNTEYAQHSEAQATIQQNISKHLGFLPYWQVPLVCGSRTSNQIALDVLTRPRSIETLNQAQTHSLPPKTTRRHQFKSNRPMAGGSIMSSTLTPEGVWRDALVAYPDFYGRIISERFGLNPFAVIPGLTMPEDATAADKLNSGSRTVAPFATLSLPRSLTANVTRVVSLEKKIPSALPIGLVQGTFNGTGLTQKDLRFPVASPALEEEFVEALGVKNERNVLLRAARGEIPPISKGQEQTWAIAAESEATEGELLIKRLYRRNTFKSYLYSLADFVQKTYAIAREPLPNVLKATVALTLIESPAVPQAEMKGLRAHRGNVLMDDKALFRSLQASVLKLRPLLAAQSEAVSIAASSRVEEVLAEVQRCETIVNKAEASISEEDTTQKQQWLANAKILLENGQKALQAAEEAEKVSKAMAKVALSAAVAAKSAQGLEEDSIVQETDEELRALAELISYVAASFAGSGGVGLRDVHSRLVKDHQLRSKVPALAIGDLLLNVGGRRVPKTVASAIKRWDAGQLLAEGELFTKQLGEHQVTTDAELSEEDEILGQGEHLIAALNSHGSIRDATRIAIRRKDSNYLWNKSLEVSALPENCVCGQVDGFKPAYKPSVDVRLARALLNAPPTVSLPVALPLSSSANTFTNSSTSNSHDDEFRIAKLPIVARPAYGRSLCPSDLLGSSRDALLGGRDIQESSSSHIGCSACQVAPLKPFTCLLDDAEVLSEEEDGLEPLPGIIPFGVDGKRKRNIPVVAMFGINSINIDDNVSHCHISNSSQLSEIDKKHNTHLAILPPISTLLKNVNVASQIQSNITTGSQNLGFNHSAATTALSLPTTAPKASPSASSSSSSVLASFNGYGSNSTSHRYENAAVEYGLRAVTDLTNILSSTRHNLKTDSGSNNGLNTINLNPFSYSPDESNAHAKNSDVVIDQFNLKAKNFLDMIESAERMFPTYLHNQDQTSSNRKAGEAC